jgi:tetratricopeptide (TPR) repeat protein
MRKVPAALLPPLLLGGGVAVMPSSLHAQVPAAEAPAALPASAPPVAPTTRAVDVLIRQAERWLSLDRLDLAASSIERALQAEPRNTEALALAARIEARRGNRAAAAAAVQRLREAGGTEAQRAAVEQAVRGATIDRAAVEEARRLSREGRAEEAAARWRAIFGAQGPTPEFATEYFQALAAARTTAEEGRRGLERQADRPDATPRARLAAAQTLTFQPETRAEGIRRLQALVSDPEVGAEARAAWRQALIWSAGDPAFAASTRSYLQRFPGDAELQRSLEAIPRPDPAAEARQQAFQRLEQNGVAGVREAAQRFEEILRENPRDADALGGLGIVRLRQGRAAEARRLLEQAQAADPARAAQWQGALDGAAYGLELAEARAALRRGDLDQADEIARSAARRQVQDATDIEVLLGELALRRGDPAGAEQRFRTALSRRPGFGPAQQGLNQALRAQGRAPEPGLPRIAAGPREPGFAGEGAVAPTGGEAGRLRAEAARTPEAGVAAALLRAAVAQAPDDPWLRLDLARALARSGSGAEGRAFVEELALRNGRPDDLFAAALFAEEQNRFGDADAFLSRIPPQRRTADMSRLATRIRARADVARAAQLLARNPAEGRVQLLTLAARPDPTGGTAAAVIRAFADANDRFGAAEAARVAEAANRAAGAPARIAIAGALLGAGLDTEALLLADQVETGPVTAEQRRALASLRSGAAIRASDRLNSEGDQARGFEALRPVLQRDPTNADAQLALARLYQGARDPAEALRIAEGILSRSPRNLDARAGALDAAIAMRDRARAEALVTEGLRFHPREARMFLLEARYARAFNDDARARRALELAAGARRAELGEVGLAGASAPGLPPAVLPNPFARSPGAPAAIAAAAAPGDRLAREIADELAALERMNAPSVQVAAGIAQRSGSSGIDRLMTITAPLEAEVTPPAIGGRLVGRVVGVSLDSGNLGQDANTLARFGAGALAPGFRQSSRSTAAGVTVGAQYRLGDWLRMDVASSPIGFPRSTVLGGLELAPQLGGVRLRLLGERRSVVDSLLSYAGQRDRVTGTNWGMVVRTGGRGQVEVPVGRGFAYLGGGYSVFDGENVANNARIEAGAGLSYPVLQMAGGELRVGADLVYFGYDRNLRFFTLGHGGYFSPQSFFAGSIPVDFRAQQGNFSYRLGGTLGYAVWREDSAPVFPNSRALQAQLEARARTDANVITRYAGQSRQNFIGGLRADMDYALTPRVNIGAGFTYDQSANWNEVRGVVRLQGRF